MAREAFEIVGNELQRRRKWDDWSSVSSFLGNREDPAELDPELNAKLHRNYEEAKTKISCVINQFADQEVQGNLEPEEVADEDAEQSAGEGSGQEEEEEIKAVEEEDHNDIEDDNLPSSPINTDAESSNLESPAPVSPSKENNDTELTATEDDCNELDPSKECITESIGKKQVFLQNDLSHEDTNEELEPMRDDLSRKNTNNELELIKDDFSHENTSDELEPMKDDLSCENTSDTLEPLKDDLSHENTCDELEPIKDDISCENISDKLEPIKDDFSHENTCDELESFKDDLSCENIRDKLEPTKDNPSHENTSNKLEPIKDDLCHGNTSNELEPIKDVLCHETTSDELEPMKDNICRENTNDELKAMKDNPPHEITNNELEQRKYERSDDTTSEESEHRKDDLSHENTSDRSENKKDYISHESVTIELETSTIDVLSEDVKECNSPKDEVISEDSCLDLSSDDGEVFSEKSEDKSFKKNGLFQDNPKELSLIKEQIGWKELSLSKEKNLFENGKKKFDSSKRSRSKQLNSTKGIEELSEDSCDELEVVNRHRTSTPVNVVISVDPRHLAPVSPPVWEEYFPPKSPSPTLDVSETCLDVSSFVAGRNTYSTAHSNLNPPVIGSLVNCECSVLEHAATEAGSNPLTTDLTKESNKTNMATL
uniref:Daxx histone-binding domain-containing protein n=1 Tax=Timema shepardi TaxID=629360 RepID=A0A7R9FXS2_TIMSH|nr:unnamed protein product [Timema shepardi]